MERILIKELYKRRDELANSKVTVAGWVRNVRISKNFGFIEINDGSFFKTVQIVIDNETIGFETASRLNVGAAIYVTGDVVLTEGAKQPFEIKAFEVILEGASTPDYPLQKKRHSFEYLRTIAHLRTRTNTIFL